MQRYDPRRPGALAHAGTFNNNVLTMAAGLAGLTQVLSAEALETLNARGQRLRSAAHAVFAAHRVGLQFTGLGSVMQLQPLTGTLRSADDLKGADDRVKALLFFELLERGIFLARRGLVALSLPFGDAESQAFISALDAAVATHRGVLPAAS
jgi:glutamate-1-semialdehyde 2,1-aminomutase